MQTKQTRIVVMNRKLLAGAMQSLIAAGVLAMLLAAASPALAGRGNAGNPGVLPPQSHPHGKSYGEWGAEWWKWALGQPEAVNPVLDPTGEFAGVGQEGSVWFLAGTFGGPATRTISVPAGKALFFPIVNTVFGAAVGDCTPPDCDLDTLQDSAEAVIDQVTLLEVEIDGNPLQNLFQYRAASPGAFSVTWPERALFGFPAGTFEPNVCDGYWLMLAPLKAGQHTIHFKSEGYASVDVTYYLTVTPHKK